MSKKTKETDEISEKVFLGLVSSRNPARLSGLEIKALAEISINCAHIFCEERSKYSELASKGCAEKYGTS